MSILTKRALCNALKKKIEEKELEDITVSELTSMCSLKRQTFYYHFKDIYDLVKWLFTNELIEEIKLDDTYESWRASCYQIFNYVKENSRLIESTYNSIAREYFISFLNKHITIFITRIIDDKLKGNRIGLEEQKFLTNFYRNALIGCVRDWIEEGLIESPEQLITKLDYVLDGHIDLFIKNLHNPKY